MHASMPDFVYLQKWFIIGYKHSKKLIGHFIKWQNYLQKILPINHFQTKSLFYVVENAFIKVAIFIGFTKYILNHKTWCLGSESLFQNISQRFSLKSIFNK